MQLWQFLSPISPREDPSLGIEPEVAAKVNASRASSPRAGGFGPMAFAEKHTENMLKIADMMQIFMLKC